MWLCVCLYVYCCITPLLISFNFFQYTSFLFYDVLRIFRSQIIIYVWIFTKEMDSQFDWTSCESEKWMSISQARVLLIRVESAWQNWTLEFRGIFNISVWNSLKMCGLIRRRDKHTWTKCHEVGSNTSFLTCEANVLTTKLCVTPALTTAVYCVRVP